MAEITPAVAPAAVLRNDEPANALVITPPVVDARVVTAMDAF